jgi:hypothetical protein
MTRTPTPHADIREGHQGMTVKTCHVYPPIPIRSFDWAAWFDEFGEDGPRGSGATEQEAVAELMATQGMTADGKCIECGKLPADVRGCSVGGCPIGEDI